MPKSFQALKSIHDRSVNFIHHTPDGGAFEARFVQRSDDYFIVYLSSHTGCAHFCRFCHLTASGQTMMEPASLDDYLAQAQVVLTHYGDLLKGGQTKAQKVHFNFMARGEALSNPVFLNQSQELFNRLTNLTSPFSLEVNFLVSSIIPKEFSGDLSLILKDSRSRLYYSLYSLDPRFRKRWLPKSKDPHQSLDEIAAFQKKTGNPIAIHWAFIQGENDTQESVLAIMQALNDRGIKAKFNAVRYNPYDEKRGAETEEETLQSLFTSITGQINDLEFIQGSRIVPRVGFDVKASCGMFVS